MLIFTDISTIILLIISCVNQCSSLTFWRPDIRLVLATCNIVTIQTKCPQLSTDRYIELTLYSVNTAILPRMQMLFCRKNQPRSVQTTFDLSCNHLYRVNVSLSPTFPPATCTEYCSIVHTSNIWLLGNEHCDQSFDFCKFINYTVKENSCTNSPIKCSNISNAQTLTAPSMQNPSWTLKVRLVKAHCFNATFEFNCPNFARDREIEFNLHSKTSKNKYSSLVKICKANIEEVIQITFPIVCKQIYFINVNLSSTLKLSECTEYCSTVQTDRMWLLGSSYCEDDDDGDMRNDCKYDQFKISENVCLDSSQVCPISTATVKPTSVQSNEYWIPNIRIFTAQCDSLTMEIDCPRFGQVRNVELNFSNEQTSIEIQTQKCTSNQKVKVKFHLPDSCINIYHVNLILTPIRPSLQCDYHCQNSIISPKWFLGSKNCNFLSSDDCKYEKHKTEKNQCPDSTKLCSGFIWKPNLIIIEAQCENTTVQAQCPKIFRESIITFSLINNDDPTPLSITLVDCRSNNNEVVNATLDIKCMNLYHINAVLNFPDEGNKSYQYQSPVLLFGKKQCNMKKNFFCQNIEYKSDVNKCDYAPINCPNRINGARIAVIIFIVVLFLSLLYVLVYIIVNHRMRSLKYTSGNLSSNI